MPKSRCSHSLLALEIIKDPLHLFLRQIHLAGHLSHWYIVFQRVPNKVHRLKGQPEEVARQLIEVLRDEAKVL